MFPDDQSQVSPFPYSEDFDSKLWAHSEAAMLDTFVSSKPQQLGAKKTNKQKTHKHFSDGPWGTIVPGTNPHPSQGQTGQNGDFTVEFNREWPVCPGEGSHFVSGRGPICPKDGSCLSRTPSRRKCLCLLVFFLPETVDSTKTISIKHLLLFHEEFSKFTMSRVVCENALYPPHGQN